MSTPPQIVISASRRTDIPAFYMPWFMERIEQGFFEVINPYNQKTSIVPATPDAVHTIVFWSKNFGPFLDNNYGEILTQLGYHLFFNFTVNSHHPILEPNLPPLTERMDQMERICRRYSPRAVNWRFDPVCYFTADKNDPDGIRDNTGDFDSIAERAADCGIERCITSFMDFYPKIKKRTTKIKGFALVDPPPDQKTETLLWMNGVLKEKRIGLFTCCEKPIMENLPRDTGILKSACIPNDLLVEMFGGQLSMKKDTGQRISQGCGCSVSSDIGSYRLHPCYNNCLFCYANPSEKNDKLPGR